MDGQGDALISHGGSPFGGPGLTGPADLMG